MSYKYLVSVLVGHEVQAYYVEANGPLTSQPHLDAVLQALPASEAGVTPLAFTLVEAPRMAGYGQFQVMSVTRVLPLFRTKPS